LGCHYSGQQISSDYVKGIIIAARYINEGLRSVVVPYVRSMENNILGKNEQEIPRFLLEMLQVLEVLHLMCMFICERQKYGINLLKIKQNFFQKNLWTGRF
jgi:hypothetical protein